jgi:hypothetical protein
VTAGSNAAGVGHNLQVAFQEIMCDTGFFGQHQDAGAGVSNVMKKAASAPGTGPDASLYASVTSIPISR